MLDITPFETASSVGGKKKEGCDYDYGNSGYCDSASGGSISNMAPQQELGIFSERNSRTHSRDRTADDAYRAYVIKMDGT